MYVTVDTGGTKTLIAVFDVNGNKLKSEKFPTNHNYDQYITELTANIKQVAGDQTIDVISIAVPGHVEEETNIVKGFSNLDWKNIDIISALSPSFEAPIIIDNDANLGCLGEAAVGAGQNKRKVLYITVSTGIGTGVTVDGKLDPATKESEGGQVLLEHDNQLMPWEKFASGKSFFEHYKKQGKDVDDPKIWQEFANNLAQGIWDSIAIIQPDIVIIGGSMGVHFEKYGEFLNQAVASFQSAVIDHPPIVQAKYPDDAVINGCFEAAKQYASTTRDN